MNTRKSIDFYVRLNQKRIDKTVHKADVFNGNMVASGLVHPSPSRKKMVYDKHAVKETSKLSGCGLVGASNPLTNARRGTCARQAENEQFRYYYGKKNTSHVTPMQSVPWAQTRDNVWKHFSETNISKDSPSVLEHRKKLSKKNPVPDRTFGIATHRASERQGKKLNMACTRRDYHGRFRIE
eukprot:g378.t1